MATPDYEQFANQLGEFYMDTADELGAYLDTIAGDPNDPRILRLGDRIDEITIYANRFFELAENIAFNALAADLQGVRDATAKIRQALKTISDIDKAIAIASAVIGLATAIVTQNGASLGASLETIGSI
jgi:hypothetical protein